MNPKISIIIVLSLVVAATAGLLIKQVAGQSAFFSTSSSTVEERLTSLQNSFKSLFESESREDVLAPTSEAPTGAITPSPEPSLDPSPKASQKPLVTSNPTIQKQTQPPAAAANCRTYTVARADGTSSTNCYSQSDYDQLVRLHFQLSSAQSFYTFFTNGVVKYQEEYDRTGSSIYLDAKASQQEKADQEKIKIDQTRQEIYTIEVRGT